MQPFLKIFELQLVDFKRDLGFQDWVRLLAWPSLFVAQGEQRTYSLLYQKRWQVSWSQLQKVQHVGRICFTIRQAETVCFVPFRHWGKKRHKGREKAIKQKEGWRPCLSVQRTFRGSVRCARGTLAKPRAWCGTDAHTAVSQTGEAYIRIPHGYLNSVYRRAVFLTCSQGKTASSRFQPLS